MTDIAVPRPIDRMLALPGLDTLARLALASPFLISGAVKLTDFGGAMNEVAGLGLQPAGLIAAAVILTQFGGSILFLTRRHCWLGAGILAVFTVIATLLAHPFWMFEGPDWSRQTATFFEHAAIVGGLALAALFVNGRSTQP
ncbi:DoxX family protein [Microvirga arsenatis]|uniref:DoxX family membrane protein n=1 Tax=Microvirga arsenatis TaxID=2692265 RepID=A0ABW9YZJ4_9HYPH|nr:DoxX family protein [Microvirga arsenatis]NBJ11629.1 DoxX family membrane protein [Microvirga arsenatis]NBJ24910.1 DoxX family membrane protein [Microvirga arsenatis]